MLQKYRDPDHIAGPIFIAGMSGCVPGAVFEARDRAERGADKGESGGVRSGQRGIGQSEERTKGNREGRTKREIGRTRERSGERTHSEKS